MSVNYLVVIVSSDGYRNSEAFLTEDYRFATSYLERSCELFCNQTGMSVSNININTLKKYFTERRKIFIEKGNAYFDGEIFVIRNNQIPDYVILKYYPGSNINIELTENNVHRITVGNEKFDYVGCLKIKKSISEGCYNHMLETQWRNGIWFIVAYDSEGNTMDVLFYTDSKEEGHEYIEKSYINYLTMLNNICSNDEREQIVTRHNQNAIKNMELFEEYYVQYKNIVFFARMYWMELKQFSHNVNSVTTSDVITFHKNISNLYATTLVSSSGYFSIYFSKYIMGCVKHMPYLLRHAKLRDDQIEKKIDLYDDEKEPEIYILMKNKDVYYSHVYKLAKPVDDYFNSENKYMNRVCNN